MSDSFHAACKAIGSLHSPKPTAARGKVCIECDKLWPCETMKKIKQAYARRNTPDLPSI